MTDSDHANAPKILLTGGRGQLGSAIRTLCEERGIPLVATDVPMPGAADDGVVDLDVTDADACRQLLAIERPFLTLHCGAWTDVDGCESDPEKADRINGHGTAYLTEACRAVRSRVVYVSTDYVFDGQVTDRPLKEDETIGPLSVYGSSKRLGEEAVLRDVGSDGAGGVPHHVVRTAWVFGPGGKNFPRAILNRAKQGLPLTVVDDQHGCPTLTEDLAEALVDLGLSDAPSGVWHATNDGHCSWFEFAAEILAQSGIDVPCEPMPSTELDRPAPRPAWSVLDCSKLETQRGRTLPHWRDALRRYLQAEAEI